MSATGPATNGTDMRGVLFLLLSIGSIVLAGCASRSVRVPDVEFACEAEDCPLRFVGNRQVSDAELAVAVAAARGRGHHELSREVVPILVKAAYYDRGFVDARVTAHAERPGGGESSLVVQIDEGEPYWVGHVTVSDPASQQGEALGDRASLRAAVSQSEGVVFARRAMLDDVRVILSGYREVGYAWADADVAVKADRREHMVSVDITILRGPAAVVDRVDVRGGEGLPEAEVQARLSTRPGDAYRESAVDASRRALSELAGAGRRVDVEQSPVPGHPERIAVSYRIMWSEGAASAQGGNLGVPGAR
jgi:hypothetical protein